MVGGTDTEALYTSLEAIEVANIVFNAVQESGIQFDGTDYIECKLGPLKRVLPRYDNVVRPGLTGEDPVGPDSVGQNQWKFPPLRYPLTVSEKKIIVVKTLHTVLQGIFKTHTYIFADKFFLQWRGRQIGRAAHSPVSW